MGSFTVLGGRYRNSSLAAANNCPVAKRSFKCCKRQCISVYSDKFTFAAAKNVKRFCSSNKINFAATKLPVSFSGSCKSVTSHQVLHRSSLQKRDIVTLKRIVPYPLSLPNKQTRNRIEPLSVCLYASVERLG